jgi:predicted lipoprotein with Yx(FWY)xxD motif
MHVNKLMIAAAAAAALFVPSAFAQEGAITMMETSLGTVLADADGMTLYIFDRDEPGVSNCYDNCAINWPPLIATEGAMAEGMYSLVTRTDGTMQWAYEGMPLYYWKNDAAPGDTTGDGVGDVWHVVVADAM